MLAHFSEGEDKLRCPTFGADNNLAPRQFVKMSPGAFSAVLLDLSTYIMGKTENAIHAAHGGILQGSQDCQRICGRQANFQYVSNALVF